MVQWSWEKTHDQEVACLNFFASGVFSIGIQTAGQIVMKFGTEVVLTGEGTWGGGGVDPVYPTPHVWGV